MTRYAYVHGFASGPQSQKGQRLRRSMAARGLELHLPDLNRPSFAELTPRGALAGVSELADAFPGDRWRFVGSSFGGFVAARWAELFPQLVERLLLLCPGFDLPRRWPAIHGETAFREFLDRGWFETPDGAGKMTRVHRGFYDGMAAEPAFPEVACPTLVVHGVHDDVVPIESSRHWAAGKRHVILREVDDGHPLVDTMDDWEPSALDWLTADRPAE